MASSHDESEATSEAVTAFSLRPSTVRQQSLPFIPTPSDMPSSTFYTPVQTPRANQDQYFSFAHSPPTETPPSGDAPTLRRPSVQFDGGADSSDGAAVAGPSDASMSPRSRQNFKDRMRSFGFHPRPDAFGRSRSAVAAYESAPEQTMALQDAMYGETDGDTTDPASPASNDAGKRRRLVMRPWMSPSRNSSTEPNTPVRANTTDSMFENSPRPALPGRSVTMADVSNNPRAGLSEDEGRARLKNNKSGHMRRRSTAWLQSAQSPSFMKKKVRVDDPKDKGSRSGPARPHRRMASSGDNFFTRTKDKTRAVFERVAQKRKQERGADYDKSAELMAELMAGSPAAIILASHFQRDERFKHKIPVLLEQLKISISESERIDDSTDRHFKFKIDLEYGNGLMRMRWTIWRFLSDFVNLHVRYAGSNIPAFARRGTNNTVPGKMPKFPKAAFPVLRGMRGLPFVDNDANDAEENNEPEREESQPTTTPRRQIADHARKISKHLRSNSNAGVPGTAETLAAEMANKREAFAAQQRKSLETYLREMIRYYVFRAGSNRLCKFLEISALGVNLAAEGGYHGKEGLLRERKGGALPKITEAKWFLVRQSYIACVASPEETVLSDVFLVDSDFTIEAKRPRIRDQKTAKEMAITAKNSAAHPSHHRLKLTNSERQLTLIARNERQLDQFAESITLMKKNTLWAQNHRFDSFAPVRENVFAEWLVDGRDYMWKVSRAISMAENVIYIHDWWLSPELYLRRPPAISHKWRLDRLLQRKAQEGVKIYVIMYRNINSAIPIDSEYSKMCLLDLHPNIYVQRSPNQVRQGTFFWAHHEKICVVDHIVAFCGGVDLCFGRWDTPEHRLIDDKRTGHEPDDFPRDSDHCQLWPGKDYSNPRVQDFFKLDEPYGEMYDRTKTPRMPWHDIGMQVVGQPARDLTRHFVQRWNFLLRQRTPHRPIPVLLPPPDFDQADLESLGFSGTCTVQMLRSASPWSLGTPKRVEHSIMNAYIKLIEESHHFVYIENQFFISSCQVNGMQIENKIGDALVERIVRAHKNEEDWMAVVIIPLMPGFQNLVDEQDGTSVRLIMQCQFRSICRGETSIFGRLRKEGIEPTEYIQFYSLRQWGKIGPEKALTTEQLYIHAKCMVVDDRSAIIGSANINERSMLGSHDSEVAAIVHDKDLIDSTMAGKPFKVGRFPHSLRMRLMREHLGIDVDTLREAEVEEFFQLEMDESGSDHLTLDSAELDSDDSLRGRKENSRPKRNFASRQSSDSDRVEGRDSAMLNGNREVLIDSTNTEGKGTLASPKRPQAAPATSERTPKASHVGLPPAMPPRMNTTELGLTQLSQLPPLPLSDDSDIGGPAMQAQKHRSIIGDIHRPTITDDCMKDPVDDAFFLRTWHAVAENNTRLFRAVFRCQPDNEVMDWTAYHEYMDYAKNFNEAQGVQQPPRNQPGAHQRTGPPGTATSGSMNEKTEHGTTSQGSVHNASATRLGTADSRLSSSVPKDNDASAGIEKRDMAPNAQINFDTLPTRDGEPSPTDEKKAPNTAGAHNNSTRRRRRANTKSGTGIRLVSKEEAEELLNLVQGSLVVFPYDWLCREEEGSKWLYGIDMMAPLEIYN